MPRVALSIGVGLSIVYTVLEEDISVRQPGLPDGEVVFDKLDDFSFQGFGGFQFRPTDRWLLGFVYRSKSDAELSGDIDFKRIAVPFALDGEIDVEWEYPQVVELGVRYWLTPELSVALNADWEDWSKFSANRFGVTIGPISAAATLDRKWKDTYHGGIAFVYETDEHSFGAGFGYDSSAVDDEDRTLDLAVDEQFKFAVGYHRIRERGFDYSLAVTALYAGDAPIDQMRRGCA